KTDAVVNVRFIAATNRDPTRVVEEGRLRKDLHYRLRVVPIHIPPLRERPEDIPILAQRFLEEFWAQHRERGAPIPTISSEAMDVLRRAPWRGNVRELRNVIEHMVVMAVPGEPVAPSDIVFLEEESGESNGQITFDRSVLSLDYHGARERVLAKF